MTLLTVHKLWSATIVLLASAAGGFVFRLLHLPLPWTLGAMFAAALIATASTRWMLPGVFRYGARPVIGVVAGSAFTPQVVSTFSELWILVPILLVFFATVTSSGFVYFRTCGYDRPTSLFASMPGGLGEMTMLGAQFGADVRKLVLVHSVRIIVVVVTIPFVLTMLTDVDLRGTGPGMAGNPHGTISFSDWGVLGACAIVGYVIGRPLRSFGGLMLAPMILSAIVHGTGVSSATPPSWLVAAMQVMIGCITGARLAGIGSKEAHTALIQGVLWTGILIGISLLAATLCSLLVNKPTMALFLAFSPGGFAEMTVIALASGLEVAFVVTCHVFRTLYIMVMGPLLHRLAVR